MEAREAARGGDGGASDARERQQAFLDALELALQARAFVRRERRARGTLARHTCVLRRTHKQRIKRAYTNIAVLVLVYCSKIYCLKRFRFQTT